MAEYKDHRGEAMRAHNTHWEKDVSNSVFPKAKKTSQLDNWIAKKDWPHTHVKVNECDH